MSTMNVGKVYFSDRMALNHAAINPVFSLMSSLSKSEDFSSQYRFSNRKRPMLFLNLYVAGAFGISCRQLAMGESSPECVVDRS